MFLSFVLSFTAITFFGAMVTIFYANNTPKKRNDNVVWAKVALGVRHRPCVHGEMQRVIHSWPVQVLSSWIFAQLSSNVTNTEQIFSNFAVQVVDSSSKSRRGAVRQAKEAALYQIQGNDTSHATVHESGPSSQGTRNVDSVVPSQGSGIGRGKHLFPVASLSFRSLRFP